MKLEWLANINAVKLNWKCKMHKRMWKHMTTLGDFNLLRQRRTRINKYSKNKPPSWNPYDNWSGNHLSIFFLASDTDPSMAPHTLNTYQCCCSHHSMIPETMWLHAGLSTSTREWKNRSCSQAAHEHIFRNPNWFIQKLNGLEHIPNHINECSCARIWTHCLPPLAKRLRLLYQKLAALSHCLLPLAKRLQELHLTGDALASGYIWII